jgi:hypothetical protein
MNTENIEMTITYYYGTITWINKDNVFAEIRLRTNSEKYNNIILKNVPNKSNTILEVKDEILLGALNNDLSTVFIDKKLTPYSYKSDTNPRQTIIQNNSTSGIIVDWSNIQFDYMGEKIFRQEKIKLDANKIGVVKYQPITIGNNEQIYGWVHKNNEWIRFDFNDRAFIINDAEPNETVLVTYYYFDKDIKVITMNANDII